MPTYVYKDKSKCKITEYQVRTIDEHGDAKEVLSFETGTQAVERAHKLIATGKERAVVVEKVVRKYPAHLFDDPTTFETITAIGDEASLKAGGWI